jgi:hypothetical protein
MLTFNSKDVAKLKSRVLKSIGKSKVSNRNNNPIIDFASLYLFLYRAYSSLKQGKQVETRYFLRPFFSRTLLNS